MSAKITGKTITLTRGDTFRATVEIFNEDGTVYEPIEGDTVRFALKQNYNSSEIKIYKDIPLDTLLLVIEPEDTKDLKQPGEYVYDIQLTHINGDIDTFISNGKFRLTEEVD